MDGIIRQATADDSDAILAIYAHYVQNTTVSFETEVPTLEAFRLRIQGIASTYPYLVCVAQDRVVGFAYASRHRERAAYRYDVETSIYLSQEAHGSGTAHALYGALYAILQKMGFFNAYAGVTLPNPKSLRFHEKFGFTAIGTHHKTGYKFGAWHDVAWLEKPIQPHADRPAPLTPLAELPESFLQAVFQQPH